MKFLKSLCVLPVIYFLFIFSGFHIVSCKKSTPTPPPNIDTIDLNQGLVAHYNFNAGSLQDKSGLSNDIIYNNAVETTDRFGHANSAYLFDGSSSYMQIKNSASLNPDSITLFAIIKVNGFYSGSCGLNLIIIKGDDSHINGFYDLGFYDFTANCGTPDLNNESFGGSFGDNPYDGAAPYAGTDSVKIKTDQWYYVAFTYDGSGAKVYVNGQLKDIKSRLGTFTPNTNDIYIGKANNSVFPFYLNGVIDELRIYNKALSAAAIQQLNDIKE